MEPTQPTKRCVSEIVKDLNPKLQNYLDALLRMLPMQVRQVHESSKHRPMVHETKAYSYMGMFYIFLIRKEISNLMAKETMDGWSCSMLKELLDHYNLPRDTYNISSDSESESEDNAEEGRHVDTEELQKSVPGGANNESKEEEKNENALNPSPSQADDELEDDVKEVECPVDLGQVHKFAESYKKFKDPKSKTIELMEDIFNTVNLHTISLGDPALPFDPALLNMDNIKTVLKHVASFDRSNILLCPNATCEYFDGCSYHFTLDDMFLQINTSVRPFQVKNPKYRKYMYQTLLYALGLFVSQGKEIRKFKIYNPLLGIEYFYEIPHVDFDEFRKLVEELKPL